MALVMCLSLIWMGILKSDGFTSGVTLNAPKGMCILDDSLYIADIDVVHVVSVHTGAFRYDVPIEGAVFLNDMACGFNEAYVSDSQNGRIHRIYKEGKAELVTDLSPRKPNGLAVQGISLFVADFGSDAVLRLSPSGSIEDQWTLPAGGLDGIAVLRDRSIVVSSWDGQAIYKMTSDGGIDTLADGIKSPADFAVDQRHNRLVVPQLTENQPAHHPNGLARSDAIIEATLYNVPGSCLLLYGKLDESSICPVQSTGEYTSPRHHSSFGFNLKG